MDKSEILAALKAEAHRRGYTFEETDEYVRLIRPNGEIAWTAIKNEIHKNDRFLGSVH